MATRGQQRAKNRAQAMTPAQRDAANHPKLTCSREGCGHSEQWHEAGRCSMPGCACTHGYYGPAVRERPS